MNLGEGKKNHYACTVVSKVEKKVDIHTSTFLLYSLFNGACGQGTNDPLKVQSLERDQHETCGVVQVYGTFWVHDMMSCSGTHILFKPSGGSLVHPAGKSSGSLKKRWE